MTGHTGIRQSHPAARTYFLPVPDTALPVPDTAWREDDMHEFSREQRLPSWRHERRRGARRRAPLVVASLLAVGLTAAACGSNAASPSTSSTGAPAASGGGGSTTAVDTATMSSLGTILVTSKGFTLYRLNKDSTNHSVCTGACAQTWPPLLVSGGGSPMAGSGVSGLGTIMTPAGDQVTYHGMPLYTFAEDTSPGQTRGQDVTDQWGTWFVVPTKAAPAGGGSTTTTAGGGGGVGF